MSAVSPNQSRRALVLLVTTLLAAGCDRPAPPEASAAPAVDELFGTLEPFASEAVYFVLTDRFVNGDPGNDHRDQGGAFPTFDRPVPGAPEGESDNIGYLGGDFRGLLDHADYIRDMGFTAVWITPIVDNPDAAFGGGKPVSWGSFWTDQGKTGYHGYWGVNFYKLDEHLPSPGLDFAGFTAAMRKQQLKVVLDIVGNHGSPSYTMPVAQPEFGKLYDAQGRLLADHQNLPPEQLDPAGNPLHAFFNTRAGIAELSDLAETNPVVLDYLAGAYLQWAGQGAAAFRIDTIGWMPHAFWKAFAERIRARHPGFFMFGEDFRWQAEEIAPHSHAAGGGISVLDFPLKAALADVFEKPDGDFASLERALYIEEGPYANPYDLMTFYDNHDMPRMNASDAGFIDAHNWLFTARGIPVIYYGSETGFQRGRAEHAGNRNYFGAERIAAAPQSAIHASLTRIARLRRELPALQRGLQLNLELAGDRAAFLRVYQRDGVNQTALVLLNKGDTASRFALDTWLSPGRWRLAVAGGELRFPQSAPASVEVAAHGVEVLVLDAPLQHAQQLSMLRARMQPTAGSVAEAAK